ncbi:MAG: HAD-IIIC family phosphatase [Candidatus Ancillula sp.]|jgi:FkbH-like protein|nr:HAD-IIIC family phosphatase [Candidatus Ancillula sp.]
MVENSQKITALELLKMARKYTKNDQTTSQTPDIKVMVLGSYSTQYISSCLEYLLNTQIDKKIEVLDGQYNSILNNVLDENSQLHAYEPDILVLLPDVEDFINYAPEKFSTDAQVKSAVQKVVDFYKALWAKIPSKCLILQANFVVPNLRALGNLEANYIWSKSSFISAVNLELLHKRPSNVLLLDFEQLASALGKNKWFDYQAYNMYKFGFSLDFLPEVVDLIQRQISATRGATKKCLVLDLDNTIWGGIVGDDGIDGIELDPHTPVGESYRHFQKYVLELKKRGVILAICSKNDEENAREPFEKNKYMILQLADISCFMANWDDKANNIKKIADVLNIGVDSMVFFDDNPAERCIVQKFIPECLVVDVPKEIADYTRALEDAHAFDWLQLTAEDLNRTSNYAANTERVSLATSFTNYADYLDALQMVAHIGQIKHEQIPRFSQLINKSNQFNLRTIRYTEAEIEKLYNNNAVHCIEITLADKFSEHGLISCIILRRNDTELFIDTWLMSCRVLKRGVEDLALEYIVELAKNWGFKQISAEYIPTKKNKMVLNFYQELGFEKVDETPTGNVYYKLEINDELETKKHYIKLRRKDEHD